MGVKKTFEEVKNEFTKNGYTLLETKYHGQQVPMKCICPNHPNEVIQLTYKSMRKYNGGCKKCGYEKLSNMHSFDYEEVKKLFEQNGYELLETEYKNTQTKMKYKCKNHPDKTLYISLGCLKRGQRCPYCSKKQMDCDLFEETLKAMGYAFLGIKEIRGQSMILYSCPNHSDKELYIRPADLRRGNGCKFCAYEKRKGVKNCNWNGGVSKLSSFLRNSTYHWKKQVLDKEELLCFVTQKNDEEIEIHHTIPFHKIRDDVLEQFGYTGEEDIGDLEKSVLIKMREKIAEKHKKVKGIPLKKSIHKKFHSIYGHDFSENDFWEFVEKYREGVL